MTQWQKNDETMCSCCILLPVSPFIYCTYVFVLESEGNDQTEIWSWEELHLENSQHVGKSGLKKNFFYILS